MGNNKSFKANNPALSYFTNQATEQVVEDIKPAPEKKAIDKETKSKRLNLLIQPSLSDDIAKIAAVNRISSNELIVRALREYVLQNKEDIEKFNGFFEK